MAYKRYYSAYGRIVKELVVGEQTGYLVPDALGSVVNVTNKTNVSTYSARYKPYGGVLASSGTAPSFTWVGRWGYNSAAGRRHGESYVRARFPSTTEGRWTSVDPLWPIERDYAYARSSPVGLADPAGLACPPGFGAALGRGCSNLKALLPPSSPNFNRVNQCMRKKGHKDTRALADLLKCMAANCAPHGVPGLGPCITCFGSWDDDGGLPGACSRLNPCKGGHTGVTVLPIPNPLPPPIGRRDYPDSQYYSCGFATRQNPGDVGPCAAALAPLTSLCSSMTFICTQGNKDVWTITFMHEMAHACGLTHYGFPGSKDYITDLECRMCQVFWMPGDCTMMGSCS